MKSTELSFVPITSYKTCKNILFIDSSTYNEDVVIDNPIVEVNTPMGYNVILNYYPKQINKFNSNSFKITKTLNPDNLTSLPSGLYTFTFSICPNDKIKHTVNYFNVCNEVKALASQICCLDTCNDKELFDKIKELIDNLHYVKTFAELCNDVKKAQALYNLTVKEINKLKLKNCGC